MRPGGGTEGAVSLCRVWDGCRYSEKQAKRGRRGEDPISVDVFFGKGISEGGKKGGSLDGIGKYQAACFTTDTQV